MGEERTLKVEDKSLFSFFDNLIDRVEKGEFDSQLYQQRFGKTYELIVSNGNKEAKLQIEHKSVNEENGTRTTFIVIPYFSAMYFMVFLLSDMSGPSFPFIIFLIAFIIFPSILSLISAYLLEKTDVSKITHFIRGLLSFDEQVIKFHAEYNEGFNSKIFIVSGYADAKRILEAILNRISAINAHELARQNQSDKLKLFIDTFNEQGR